ncbi:MAG: diaminopimelate epimerase [Deltaproteobacteria bacterium HGW-Deltaproteobacteria-22]|jgi:diaminopimelate epimerase|nr:MAG: diaminopimelate epimerase [Deltaproteobacteria bacterium HGW-Deltaproteobacteria-22]
MTQSFRKYQALQNDYLLFDAIDAPLAFTPAQIIAMCHRRTGAGADGILIVSRDAAGVFRMDIHNNDGTEAAMCGNGLRCVGKYLADSRRIAPGDRCEVLTKAGPRHVTVLEHGPDVSRVIAGLGRPRVLDDRLVLNDLAFVHVDVGNPHIVHFFEATAPRELAPGWNLQMALSLGPELEHALEGGVNVGFAVPTGPAELDLVVWERGAGFTQACGTGATAAVTAALHLGHVGKSPIRVLQNGGIVDVTLDDDGYATLDGPAHFVFAGTLPD